MAKSTKIQWCDSTVNPIAGCGGCELYPAPAEITTVIDGAIQKAGYKWTSGETFRLIDEMIAEAWDKLPKALQRPEEGFLRKVTSTSIYHGRKVLQKRVAQMLDAGAGKIPLDVIESKIVCYAAKSHINRGRNIFEPYRESGDGYAPMFEIPTQFPGRMAEAADWKSLVCTDRPKKPWLNGLPRLIFVSDMGDALSQKSDFEFLAGEMQAIQSFEGKRHLWLWLTKRPQQMRQFAELHGGLPDNVCAMTTVTSRATLSRVAALRDVQAKMRGLSLEPLWEPIADQIDLSGIDWVIVGGESGAAKAATPFPLEWAMELRDRCQEQGTAFFVKQLGRCPTLDGKPIELKDSHGGNWDEWSEDLRDRKMPKCFRDYIPTAVNHSPVPTGGLFGSPWG